MYQFKKHNGQIWLKIPLNAVFVLLQKSHGFVSPGLFKLEAGQIVTIKEGFLRRV